MSVNLPFGADIKVSFPAERSSETFVYFVFICRRATFSALPQELVCLGVCVCVREGDKWRAADHSSSPLLDSIYH